MTGQPKSIGAPSADDRGWWRTGVVYQIYPRSFADTDGDGVGDLPGIIEQLDHLAGGPDSLGVDAIWLSPIYPSPGLDLGYDVSDHEAIDPLFGTLADFDRLVADAHRRGLKVILDLVLNHTSDAHPWFQDSREARTGPYADRYLWRDPGGFEANGVPLPPNDWVSFFGGPGWTWEPRRGQFYQHIFLPQQPDVNWRDPATRAAQERVIRTWLERGVDGFRLDTFNNFLKHPDMPSNPRQRGRSAWARQLHVHEKDQPDLPALLDDLWAIVDERPGRMTVGELFYGSIELAASLYRPGHLVFDFDLLTQPWSASAFARALDRREAAFGPARWPTTVFSNHDQPRHVSHWGDGRDHDAIARASAVLLLTLRGTPFLYYGEELGVPTIDVPKEIAIDPPARHAGPDFPWWNRDQSRAPMPWTGDEGAGFTTGRPWLPLPADAATRNVARQRSDPGSVLSFYRRLLDLRRRSPALQRGSWRRLRTSAPGTLAYLRRAGDEAALIVVAFTGHAVSTTVEGVAPRITWRTALSTHEPPPADLVDGGRVALRPSEAAIWTTRPTRPEP
jgi:alpha-glucosidase